MFKLEEHLIRMGRERCSGEEAGMSIIVIDLQIMMSSMVFMTCSF